MSSEETGRMSERERKSNRKWERETHYESYIGTAAAKAVSGGGCVGTQRSN